MFADGRYSCCLCDRANNRTEKSMVYHVIERHSKELVGIMREANTKPNEPLITILLYFAHMGYIR